MFGAILFNRQGQIHFHPAQLKRQKYQQPAALTVGLRFDEPYAKLFD
jgi:hypothetical protein